MIVRQADFADQARIDELFAIAFEQPLNREHVPTEDSRVHNWAAFDDSGDMMSTFAVTDFGIQFDGNCCLMGGIGGVATLPQYRRRGGIRGCFQAALPHMYENGYDFSYLYPFSTCYYRQFGYENCVQKYQATVDLGLLKVPKPDGYFRLAERAHPMTEEIRSIDARWEAKFNMTVMHRGEFYRWTEKFDPAATGEFTYVCFDSAGRPNAYTTFSMENQSDGRNLQCRRFFFVDKAGFTGLMCLFKSLSADHRYVKFVMPAIPAMQYLMPEWSLGAAQWSVLPGGMVRVVNAAEVLKKARYRGCGSLTLEVRDPQIPQNNGRYAISFENGKALSVEHTQAEADAVLEIPTFSALIAGVWDFDEAKNWMSGLEIRNPDANLNQVFYRKNLMLVDSF